MESTNVVALASRLVALEQAVRSTRSLEDELKDARMEIASLRVENKTLRDKNEMLHEKLCMRLENQIQSLDCSSISIPNQVRII